MCPGFTGCRKCRQGRKDGNGSSKPWPPTMDRADRYEDRAPEIRLLVSLAQARALSERRNGRLLPWPEGERRRPKVGWWLIGEVGEGPGFIRVSAVARSRVLGPV